MRSMMVPTSVSQGTVAWNYVLHTQPLWLTTCWAVCRRHASLASVATHVASARTTQIAVQPALTENRTQQHPSSMGAPCACKKHPASQDHCAAEGGGWDQASSQCTSDSDVRVSGGSSIRRHAVFDAQLHWIFASRIHTSTIAQPLSSKAPLRSTIHPKRGGSQVQCPPPVPPPPTLNLCQRMLRTQLSMQWPQQQHPMSAASPTRQMQPSFCSFLSPII